MQDISIISFSNSSFPASVKEYTAFSGIFPSFSVRLVISPFSSNWITFLYIDGVLIFTHFEMLSSRKLKFKSPAQKRQIKISSPK